MRVDVRWQLTILRAHFLHVAVHAPALLAVQWRRNGKAGLRLSRQGERGVLLISCLLSGITHE